MELQLAVQSAGQSNGHGRNHTGNTTAKAIPSYLRPSTGSCHHACKYGGTHAFDETGAPSRAHQPRPRKHPPAADQQKRPPVRARLLVPRKLFGDRGGSGGGDKVVDKAAAAAGKEKKPDGDESVEWKDIAAYDMVPKAGHAGEQVDGDRNLNGSMDKKQLVINKAVRPKMMTGSKVSTEPTHRTMTTDTETVRPPRGKKPTVVVAKKEADIDRELVDGYQPLSPSLLQNRVSLLRDLEQELVREAAPNTGESKAPHSLDQEQEQFAAAAAETRRPVPAHRRVKSMMSVSSSSRSVVRFPITRQASGKSSAAFKLRSRSSRAPPPVLPSEEPRLARLRSRRGSAGGGGDEVIGGSAGRGVQLRIRSLRRRGVGGGGSGGAGPGFVVPAVALRHQKTMERKRSMRLYNNVIEETASKLVKARKSRVKALVGAFESVISKIAK